MAHPASLSAQSAITGGTALVVRILPEARLNPQSITVSIRVDESGAVVAQSATLHAWIRAVPGHPIQFVARTSQVSGPSGFLPPASLRWEGVAQAASGGGEAAQCTSGAFSGTSDLLASGWGRSGTLTCQVRFSLNGSTRPAPGVYTAQVDLALYAQ